MASCEKSFSSEVVSTHQSFKPLDLQTGEKR